ncbi:hypothetical protein ABZ814_32230, partial [Micromonospora musae]
MRDSHLAIIVSRRYPGRPPTGCGAFEVALLHYTMDGPLLDLLTTSVDAGFDADEVVSAFVARLVA